MFGKIRLIELLVIVLKSGSRDIERRSLLVSRRKLRRIKKLY